MIFGFGIDLEDIELARKLVEDLTGLPAEEEFHVDTGGVYYKFAGPDGEELILIRNLDLYDNQPLVGGFDEWPVVLLLSNIDTQSSIVQRLSGDKRLHLPKRPEPDLE